VLARSTSANGHRRVLLAEKRAKARLSIEQTRRLLTRKRVIA